MLALFQNFLYLGATCFALGAFLLFYISRVPHMTAGADWWGTALLLSALAYFSLAFFSQDISVSAAEPLHNLFVTGWVFALYSGSRRHFGQTPFLPLVSGVFFVVLAWIIFFAFGKSGSSFLLASLLPVLYWSGLQLLTARIFFQNRKQAPVYRFIALLLLLNSLHYLDYLFLRAIDWLAPYGFLLAAALVTMVAFLLLYVKFDEFRKCLWQDRAEALRLAMFDHLTGLLNRLGLDEKFRQALASNQPPLCLLYIDLDDFKPVNDRYGHATGDEVLKIVGQRVQNCVHERDFVSRLGGDEYAVLLTGQENGTDIGEITRRIHNLLCQPMIIDRHEIRVGCSIGVARFSVDGHSLAELLSDADRKMYLDKLRQKSSP